MEKLSQISLTCLSALLIAAKIGNKSGGTRSLLQRKMSFGELGIQPGTWAEEGKAEKKHRKTKMEISKNQDWNIQEMPVICPQLQHDSRIAQALRQLLLVKPQLCLK